MVSVSDKAVADLATYAPDQIGRTRYRTPEGYLYCVGVPIARTGPMVYASDEVPGIERAFGSPIITITRDGEVLFDADCMASYSGKPITNDHPPVPVTPRNFKRYAAGTVLLPRQGEGAEAECLIADLLVTDADLIDDVEAGKVEVSAGYDMEVEQVRPGLGRQTKNLGNHVALVKRARGGPVLSIKDAEEPNMATRNTRKILDGIRKAFRAKDEAALEEHLEKAEGAMDEEGGEGDESTHRIVIEVKPPEAETPASDEAETGEPAREGGEDLGARLDRIEQTISTLAEVVKKLAGAESAETSGEAAAATTDEDPEMVEEEEKADATQVQDAASKAEILSPGIRLPVKDSKDGGVKRGDLTGLRRSALKAVANDAARRPHLDAVLAGRAADFDAMKPAMVAMVFDSVAAVTREANNARAAARSGGFVPQGPMTAAKLQERIVAARKQGSI